MSKWRKFRERLAEPSTAISLGAVVAGIGQVVDWDDAPLAAETVTQAVPALATGDYVSAAALILGGIFGALMKEKARS